MNNTHTHDAQYIKDYSLLRPFDLEAAKRGDPVQYNSISDQITYLAGPDTKGNIAYQSNKMVYIAHVNLFKMAPLAWVEGKPVYRGDVLYYTKNTGRMDGPIEMHITSSDKHGLYGDTVLGDFVGNFDNLTWKKPKTKREGWVNIYKDIDIPLFRYNTKKEADSIADFHRVACVRIEWEE